MTKIFKSITLTMLLGLFITSAAFATGGGHDMAGSEKFGNLIHKSKVDGYSLEYYFMDLRNQGSQGHDTASNTGAHDSKNMEMEKPHHLMVYITDDNHKMAMEGKVGFLIKDTSGNKQKAMGMFMSNGFGATADMKKKGVYTIVTKAVVGDKKLMDTFEYEIK